MKLPAFARVSRYSGRYRPAWRMSQTGVCGVGSRRQARRKVSFWRGANMSGIIVAPIIWHHDRRNSMLAQNVLQTIGNTPHIRINRLFGSSHSVYIKSERANPGGSIKDRIAVSMVEAAEAAGALRPGATIVEPTSGNTGVGLAMVAAVKGYKLVLVMPDSMSVERRRLMLAYGASFVLTPREKGMSGSIARALELIEQTPGSWMPQQFENQANIDVHVRTTAQEIAADFPSGVDALITGVGTGGHITGCAQRSEEHTSELQSRRDLVCRLLLEKKKKNKQQTTKK